MKIILVLCSLMLAAGAQAASHHQASTTSDNEVTGALGLDRGAMNLGAEYERRMDPLMGWGGYFLFQSSKDKNGSKLVYEVMSLGAEGKVHLLDNGQIDAYVAPGFGLHMIKDVPDGTNKSDVSTLGPTLRIGAMVTVAPTISVGVSHLELWNWFDDKGGQEYGYYQAAVAFDF